MRTAYLTELRRRPHADQARGHRASRTSRGALASLSLAGQEHGRTIPLTDLRRRHEFVTDAIYAAALTTFRDHRPDLSARADPRIISFTIPTAEDVMVELPSSSHPHFFGSRS